MVGPKNTDVTAQLSPTGGTGSSAHLKALMLGRFRLIALLGEGAMGKVLRAEDTKLKRHVALKCFKRKSDESGERDEQFVREARAAAVLDHPGIVQVFEIGVAEGFHYIAMELIEGGTLAALIKGCGSLDLPRAAQLCAEAAEALAYAAEHGIVHRDIKPENLLLTRAGRCKITDFGLAFVNDLTQTCDPGLHAVGTPAYVAPEVVGGFPATEKSDVYSLAAVLFFLLAGKPPFQAVEREKVMRMHIDTLSPDVRTLRPELSESIARTLARALSKDPDDRPNAEIFAQQLRAHTIPLGDSQVLSVTGPSTPPEPAQYTQPSNRWQTISLLAGTLAVIAVVIIAWIVLRAPSSRATPALPSVSVGGDAAQGAHPVAPSPAVQNNLAAAVAEAQIAAYSSRNREAILAAADAHQRIFVVGTVKEIHLDKVKRTGVLTFSDSPDFAVAYGGELYDWMSGKFGGKDGDGIVGKSIRVTGTPTFVFGTAVIMLNNTSEIDPAP